MPLYLQQAVISQNSMKSKNEKALHFYESRFNVLQDKKNPKNIEKKHM